MFVAVRPLNVVRYRLCSSAFCLFSLCCALSLSGQNKPDSLQRLFLNNPPDSSRVDIYLLLARESSDNDTISKYIGKAIATSIQIGDAKRIAKSYLRLARKNDYEGNLYGARQALAKVEEQLPFVDNSIRANYFLQLGIIDYFEAIYNEAIASIWKAVRLYESFGDSVTVASCYLNIGSCYKELDNLDKTLEYYLKAMDIYENSGNELGAAMAYGNIGNVYKDKGESDNALRYYNKSLEVNQKNDQQEEVRIDLNNIGNIFLEKGQYATARSFFNRSLEIATALGSDKGIATANYNLGAVLLRSGNHESAIRKFNEALALAKARKFREDIKDIQKILSETYEDLGKFQLALGHRKEYETIRDSLISEAHLNEAKEQELKYQTENKDRQIQMLGKEKELAEIESQRESTLNKAYIGGLILIILLIGLTSYIIFQRMRNQKLVDTKNNEIKEINFRHQLSELEMKALRAQINPHFLFNCMNSINRMILAGETENASLYLTKFSKLVRLILENAERTRISLENELTLLESYIQLEELRFKGKIDYKISVDESVEKESTFLPSMVLQPFVENAIWHGLMHKDNDKGIISIDIREKDDRLLCTIEDNGVGREMARLLSEKSILKKKSMGMKITEERLRLLSRERLEQLIQITDLKDALNHALGTRVVINIPIS